GLQLAAQGLAEVGHFIEVGDVAMVDPLHHLVGTELLLAKNLDEELLQARAIEVEQVLLASGGCLLRQRLDGGGLYDLVHGITLSAKRLRWRRRSRRFQSRRSRPSPSRGRRWHRWIRRSRRGWCPARLPSGWWRPADRGGPGRRSRLPGPGSSPGRRS